MESMSGDNLWTTGPSWESWTAPDPARYVLARTPMIPYVLYPVTTVHERLGKFTLTQRQLRTHFHNQHNQPGDGILSSGWSESRSAK